MQNKYIHLTWSMELLWRWFIWFVFFFVFFLPQPAPFLLSIFILMQKKRKKSLWTVYLLLFIDMLTST